MLLNTSQIGDNVKKYSYICSKIISMKIKLIFILLIGLLASCSNRYTYDPDIASDLVDQYAYNSSVDSHNEYDQRLRSITQDTYHEMICQLYGILLEVNDQLSDIKAMKTIPEQRRAMEDFDNSSMVYYYRELNGIVDDANYRKLLDESNSKLYKEVIDYSENDIDKLYRSIANMIR